MKYSHQFVSLRALGAGLAGCVALACTLDDRTLFEADEDGNPVNGGDGDGDGDGTGGTTGDGDGTGGASTGTGSGGASTGGSPHGSGGSGTGGGPDPVHWGTTLYESGTGTAILSPNDAGMQGYFFPAMDGLDGNGMPRTNGHEHSIVTLVNDSTICLSGNIARVKQSNGEACGDLNCDYNLFWGAAVHMRLDPSPYDATAIQGFRFILSGDVEGAVVRFSAHTTNLRDGDIWEIFCIEDIPLNAEFIEVDFSDLQHSCWPTGVPDPELSLDLENFESLHWQILSTPDNEYTVTNFCLEHLEFY